MYALLPAESYVASFEIVCSLATFLTATFSLLITMRI